MGMPAAVPTVQSFKLAAHCRVLSKSRYNFRSEVMLWHRAVDALLPADVQVSYRAVFALLSTDVQFSYCRRSAQTMALTSLPLWHRHMLLRLR